MIYNSKFIKFIIFCIIFIFIFSNLGNIVCCQELGTVLDTCFSPDCKSIAFGTTKGLFILDSKTFNVIQQYSIPNVWLIKWNINSPYLILVLKENPEEFKNSDPDLWAIYDYNKNTIIEKFKNNLNFTYPPGIQMTGHDSTTLSARLVHSQLFALIEKNTKIAYIDSQNNIVKYDIMNNIEEAKQKITNITINAMGNYISKYIWVGTENSNILYFNPITLNIEKTSTLKPMQDDSIKNAERKVFEISPDGKYAVIHTDTYIYYNYNVKYIECYALYDIDSNDIVQNLSYTISEGYEVYVSRFAFSNDSKYLYMIIHNSSGYGYSIKKLNLATYNIENSMYFQDADQDMFINYLCPSCLSQEGNFMYIRRNVLYYNKIDYILDKQKVNEIYPNNEISTCIKNFRQY